MGWRLNCHTYSQGSSSAVTTRASPMPSPPVSAPPDEIAAMIADARVREERVYHRKRAPNYAIDAAASIGLLDDALTSALSTIAAMREALVLLVPIVEEERRVALYSGSTDGTLAGVADRRDYDDIVAMDAALAAARVLVPAPVEKGE